MATTRSLSRLWLPGIALAAAALLLAPAASEAKNPTFKVAASGNQVVTWGQGHTPQFACDATVDGNGSQELYWQLEDPVKLELVRPKSAAALLAAPGDQMAEHGYADPVYGVATVKREADVNIVAPGGNCNGTGGWDGTKPPPDCGFRFGRIGLNIGYGAPDGFSPPTKQDSNLLHVRGPYDQFSTEAPEGDYANLVGEPLGHTYADCAFWARHPSPAGVDRLLPGGERVPAAKLARLKKGKKLTVSGGDRIAYADGDFNGDTTSDWKLKLTRVG
jgi:hypothetical protein